MIPETIAGGRYPHRERTKKMSITIKVPNFRVSSRLISWMQANGIKERVPSAEKVFFKEEGATASWNCARYARIVGRLPPELEAVILKSPSGCVLYAESVEREEFPEAMVDACGVNPATITKLAGKIGRVHRLEDKIDTPEDYVEYVSQLRERIPEMEERILFSGRFSPSSLAMASLKIMDKMTSFGYGPIKDSESIADRRLKELVRVDSQAVMSYMDILSRRNTKVGPDFYEAFAGNGKMLLKLADHLGKRLPENLEDTWDDPRSLAEYAQRYVRRRLPEHLENILVGDTKAAHDYAFNVVRAYSSPRLSDALHNAMILSPQDEFTKRYVAEVTRLEK